MRVHHDEGRAAFLDGLDALLDVARGLDDDGLVAASRCRGWTVGDVLVHVHLGLQEMLLGVVSPTDAESTCDAAAYWTVPVPRSDSDSDRIGQVRFVRLLGAAYRRPRGLVAHLVPTADGLARAVAELPDGRLRFQGHVLTTGDFLATWAVELAVHHLDLGRELRLAGPAPSALRLARATVEALAGTQMPIGIGDAAVVLAGTGRVPAGVQEFGSVAARLPVLG